MAGASAEPWAAPDARRRLQLALGALWLLDAILQFQGPMFTPAFSRMLTASAAGGPAVLAGPVTWSAGLIGQHAVAANTVFGSVQLLIGLGIAWRRSTRIALGVSVLWAAAVWWLGEGYGGLPGGAASPVSGAPGAVLLYAVAAVLLWPSGRDRPGRDRPAPFVAGRAVGARAARAVWLALWAGLAWLALQPAARAPRGLATAISAMAAGQPAWLATSARHLAALLAGQGLLAASLLAATLLVVAAGPYLPPPWARATLLLLALVVAAFLWLAQGLGGIFTGSATDPSSAPLLAPAGVGLLAHGRTRAQPYSRKHGGMSAPPWLTASLAAVMIAVAGYCVARLVSAWWWRRPTELDADGTHAVMGVAMAGMLAAGLRTLPAGMWAVVFGAAAVWFGGQAVRAQRGAAASPWRCPHPLPHVVESAAMVYMLLAVRGVRPGVGPRGAAAMSLPGAGGHLPVLALGLALFLIGYVMWVGDRLTKPAGPAELAGSGAGPGAAAALAPCAPRTVACCKIAMGLTMGYMLITMV